MPRAQPFTKMCQQFAQLTPHNRCDLHNHTTASDGDYTPSQLVAHAQNNRLKILGVADHDTFAGVKAAQDAAKLNLARPIAIEPGVEISTSFDGREYHLLVYRFDLQDAQFNALLEGIRSRRRDRFAGYLQNLKANGYPIPESAVASAIQGRDSLGRRQLFDLLREQYPKLEATRMLSVVMRDARSDDLCDHRVPIADAIEVVHAAGGVTSLAHPSSELVFEQFAQFQSLGLDAIETQFPSAAYQRTLQLSSWAKELKFGATGGSDCHGPEPRSRQPGTCTIAAQEWLDWCASKLTAFTS